MTPTRLMGFFAAFALSVGVASAASTKGCCVWSNENAAALEAAIAAAPEHGLNGDVFGTGSAEERQAMRLRARHALFTRVALSYATAMSRGVGSAAVSEDNSDRKLQARLNTELRSALREGTVKAWLGDLAPKAREYRHLKYALASYREMAAAGGWETLPSGRKLSLGDTAERVSLLKERLRLEGDLTDAVDGPEFDQTTSDALIRFQARHGLAADGVLGPATLGELNVSIEDRVRTIQVNLDRWRSFGRSLAASRVEVNTAAASLSLYDEGKIVLRMKAVVGKPKHDTPMLKSAIRTVIVNPQWVVPQSIVKNEIGPKLEEDPDYLTRNNMFWQGGNLVQESGPQNALGRIKFEFPNPYRVYLHDTPARSLFGAADRAQSHGCVRLEQPLDLAEALLEANDVEWTREKIEDAIRGGTTKHVALKRAIPVVLSYWTAFVEEDGTINFRPDLYDRDGGAVSS